jgi:hypothetical protein
VPPTRTLDISLSGGFQRIMLETEATNAESDVVQKDDDDAEPKNGRGYYRIAKAIGRNDSLLKIMVGMVKSDGEGGERTAAFALLYKDKRRR